MEAAGRALIVTLGRSRGALAALRALSRSGWTVGVGTPDGGGMVTASRWCAATHAVPRPRGDGDEFVRGVRSAVEHGRYDVVFGAGDDWMAALSTYRSRIPACVAHPGPSVVAVALDKVELTRRATAAGLAAPVTEPATSAALERWSGPVVVKCRAHWTPGQSQALRIEARRYPDAVSARSRVSAIARAGLEPVLQAPVEGRLGALIGLFADGRLRGRVQQITTGLWPTPSGVSSRAHTVEVDERLAQRSSALLRDLRWSGLVELQFLWDDRGEPWLIDLNGRFYGSMALASAAGDNLADAWARQALDRPLPALADGRPGQRFLWTAGDLRRATVERRGGLLADVGSVLRALPGATTSVWDPADPGPTWHLVASRLRQRSPAGAARTPVAAGA